MKPITILIRAAILYFLVASANAQSLPYADADNPSQAVGMMKMTISLAELMQEKCVARFPELQGTINSQVMRWQTLDGAEIAVANRYWGEMVKKNPDIARQIDEMTKQAYESKLVAPFRGAAPEVETQVARDYCEQYFNELATGVWRKRTPHLYQFLAQEPQLEVEISRLMDALGWPRMVSIALQRGDLQRVAKTKLREPSETATACVDERYTQKRVLARIAAGYQQVYSDPTVVAETTRYVAEPGFQQLLAKMAARAPAVGASAAHEESKSSAWQSLTPEEQRKFREFSETVAGKTYLAVRPAQLKAHQAQLAALAEEIVQECSQ